MSTVARIAACRLSGSVTSARIAIVSFPARCAASSPAATSISAIATLAPSQAKKDRGGAADPVSGAGDERGSFPAAAASVFPSSALSRTITPSAEEEHHDRYAPVFLDPALLGDAAIDSETARAERLWMIQAADRPAGMVDHRRRGVPRRARRRGEGPFPAPVMSSRARTIAIAGKDGNEIALRVIAPETKSRGIYLHLHGGGWVLGGADMQDPMLERIADNTGQVVVAPEYRLAPEHPARQGRDDCEAAAVWLVENGRREFGTNTLTIGGESAARPPDRSDDSAHARSPRLHRVPRRQSRLRRLRSQHDPEPAPVRRHAADLADDRHAAILQRLPADEYRAARPTSRRFTPI